jgi:hypothetical protein
LTRDLAVVTGGSIAAASATQRRRTKDAPDLAPLELLKEGYLTKVGTTHQTCRLAHSFFLFFFCFFLFFFTFIKEGGARKTWKTRYFVLTNQDLSYFKLSGDSTPIDTLPLNQYQACKPAPEHQGKFCFSLIPIKTGARTYYMTASSSV